LHIEWWCVFDELTNGTGEFPREMRSSYWSSQDENTSDDNKQPIPTEKIQDFMNWISEYIC
jgi:hypothetical protein